MKIIYKLFLTTLLFIAPNCVFAAVLYMDPAEGQFGPGDEFTVDIKIDVGQSCINTVDVNLGFPQGNIKAVDFLTGDSIINIWVEKPSTVTIGDINNSGLIHFSGGIPGGFCGRIPGDPGFSNVLARLVFKIPSMVVSDTEKDNVEINFLDNTKVYLNDGLGTEDKIVTKGASFALAKIPQEEIVDWKDQLKNDTIPPEPFVIELHQNAKMYENKFYIIFNTVDKQTGVDHYEVMESVMVAKDAGTGWKKFIEKFLPKDLRPEEPKWITAGMPYVLLDQGLRSVIKVKAVDKAGNDRIEEYIPPEPLRQAAATPYYNRTIFIGLIIGALLIIVFIIIFIIKRRRQYAEDKKNS